MFTSEGPINSKSALHHVMTGYETGDEPYSEQMIKNFATPYGVTRPQWINEYAENIHMKLR